MERLLQSLNLFDKNYAVDDTTLLIIEKYFNKNLPLNIVDLGSGRSTIFVANLIKKRQIDANIIAVDESEYYGNITKKVLELNNLNAKIIIAPIANDWYSLGWIPKLIDFVIVDGPRNPNGKMRSSMMNHLGDKLSSNAIIVIDDAKRDGESKMIENWCKQGWRSIYYNTERGCVVLERLI